MRRRAEPADAGTPPAIVPALRLALTEEFRRWVALLRQFFEVEPLACPACHGTMRFVALITRPSVLAMILTHRHTRASRTAHPGARRGSTPNTRPTRIELPIP